MFLWGEGDEGVRGGGVIMGRSVYFSVEKSVISDTEDLKVYKQP